MQKAAIKIGHTSNYATVYIGKLSLKFSYETVIAFFGPDDSAVSTNEWGTTTGKHLNQIDNGDKKSRVNREEFERRLSAQLERLGLSA